MAVAEISVRTKRLLFNRSRRWFRRAVGRETEGRERVLHLFVVCARKRS